MPRARLPKRPPTPSAPDEEEPEDLMMLPVGTEAEVRNDDPGFLGSFYEVTVTGHHQISRGASCYMVVYTTLVADDGAPLEETAAADHVRPRPPRARRRRGFEVHEAVEAFHNEGWWAGVVSAVRRPPVAGAPRVYQVAFPTSREVMEFEQTALRPHRVFQAGRWVPAAEVGDGCPLFQEGTRVEVSGSAKSFGERWRPASVLKVIGASNFLVKYTHIGNRRELASEILDAQYIRPAHTWRKYIFSPLSHVDVMHEGSWWPGVIMEVLGSRMDKYKVKLKSYETDMDNVECLEVLTVENTQLRLQLRWDGKTWLRRLEEKSATGPMLASRKRPISCGLSLHKEIGETSDEHGSYREKKLKNANVLSEPIPPLSSVCNEGSAIKHKSSSYPGETVKQGNAVLAPPSLPLTAGFAHLSDSSLAQSSHLEQASSQKIFVPSAPVSQSQQLQALMFGPFGQPRPLPQGPLLGAQSLSPQTPKKGAAAKSIAKSIDEARNILSISADLAKPKNGADDVELGYNVTAGCGMISEVNTLSFVDPTTTTKDVELDYNVTAGCEMISEVNTLSCVDPTVTTKDVGGTQHEVSQHGGDSAMDDRLPESLAIQHLPFVKTSPLWPQIDAMEIFSKGPQRPHLNKFLQHGPEYHEGMALGLMISFANLAENINRLDVEDDVKGQFEGLMQGLSLLEENGFDVGDLRSRLEDLLCRKNRHHKKLRDDGAMKTLKEKIAHEESNDRELVARIRVLGMALHHLGLYARLMRDMMRSAVTQKIRNAMDISRLKAEADKLKRSAVSAAVWR